MIIILVIDVPREVTGYLPTYTIIYIGTAALYDNKIIILGKRLLSGITTHLRRNIKNNFQVSHPPHTFCIKY